MKPETRVEAASRKKNHSAFSLVEIVLALGLVSFSLLAIFALVAQGQKTSRESRLESVAALLAGKATSQLRASAIWTTNDTNNYIGTSTLADIAAGQTVTTPNYYDLNLSNVSSNSPDRQFAMITEVSPFVPAQLVSSDTNVSNALSRLPAAKNTVLLNITVSYPALAPDANRSKRYFSSIITRTSPN